MYGMTTSGGLFADRLTEWLLKAGFIQSQFQISIYYKCVPDGTKIFILSYIGDCLYRYTSEALGKWFVDNLGKILHLNFLGYAHWSMSIRISQMKDHSISVYQARYSTSVVVKYFYTATVKASKRFIRPLCHLT